MLSNKTTLKVIKIVQLNTRVETSILVMSIKSDSTLLLSLTTSVNNL